MCLCVRALRKPLTTRKTILTRLATQHTYSSFVDVLWVTKMYRLTRGAFLNCMGKLSMGASRKKGVVCVFDVMAVVRA